MPKPKKLYKLYKLYNAKKHLKIKLYTQEKNLTKFIKKINYKCLPIRKINLNFFNKSNKFCKKPKERICFLLLCDVSKVDLFHSL